MIITSSSVPHKPIQPVQQPLSHSSIDNSCIVRDYNTSEKMRELRALWDSFVLESLLERHMIQVLEY